MHKKSTQFMKTILLPTDFSANSLNAVKYAFSIFGNEKMKFILLNAYRITPISIEEYVTEKPDFAKQSEKGLKKVLNSIEKNFPGKKFNIETISKLGYPVETMKKIVKRKKIDLTIMGTKGAHGLREVLIGSITSDAIKNLPCPILAVPEKAKFETMKNIAFAADLKSFTGKILLNPLFFIAKNFSSEISILHVQKKINQVSRIEKKQKSKLNSLFRKIPHSFNIVEESDAVRGIENFISSRDMDMIAMISRKHTLIERFFNKSVTKKIAMHMRIPLLALKNQL